ncbi:MAG: uncharacterized protein JWP09_438 [Candidatus Taylorbacteria bacterium]|nr:uncharacterized protein [Candidatus Taylorbacteria bacterium]
MSKLKRYSLIGLGIVVFMLVASGYIIHALNVASIRTPEQIKMDERIAKNKALADEKQAEVQKVKDAKDAANLATWKSTKAGQLCAKHPDWSKEDCDSLASNKIKLGMTYDMLVYLRGKADHVNPSNYGNGTMYQYCWDDYTPDCFYDKDGDGTVDAYN